MVAWVVGAVTVFGFAPFHLYPLPILTLAALFLAWQRAASARRSAALGFAYGLGLFLCGASWVYVSLHDFGAMPAPLAVIATLLFCVILASLPALAGYLCRQVRMSRAAVAGLWVPAAWTLTEWTRGWIFTGFPWLAMGYSQVPLSPLSGYAPILGVYGVSLTTAVSAGMIALLWQRFQDKADGGRRKEEGNAGEKQRLLSFLLHPSAFLLVLLWAGGWGLKHVEWTEPTGEPVTVSLIQGNIAQEIKWREDRLRQTLDTYLGLVRAARGRLIILPETALPLFLDQVPTEYLETLATEARRHRGDILIGVPERTRDGNYYNSVVSLGVSPSQVYRKSHLVPFGEFIPLRPVLGWIVGILSIPLQDFSRGSGDQLPLDVAGQRVAINICYEDAFGEEIIRQLPTATLLVNVSNVAWFGRSIAPRQHLQISQTRALEAGRYMLRATNTGVTGVINPRGAVEVTAAEFATAVVAHEVRGFRGATPFVRWGNYAVLALCGAFVAIAFATRAR
jgi:apolipoprotein N-acyltransferase